MPVSKLTINLLNKYGLVDYTPGQILTRGQKGYLTKVIKKYSHLLKHPEDFHVAKVSEKTAKELKDSGFNVGKNNKAIIPKNGYEKVRVKKGQIIFEGYNKKNGTKIIEKTTISKSNEFFDKLKRISKKKLKRNEYLTIKIGDNSSANSLFTSYEDLYKYVTEIFKPKSKDAYRYMSIVEILPSRKNAEKKRK